MVYKKGHKGKNSNQPSKHFSTLVKKVVQKQAEHKFLESAPANIAADAAAAAATVVKSLDALAGNIIQGVTNKTRIGDRIRLQKMEFNAVLVPTASAVGTCRLLIGQVLDVSDPAAPTMRYDNVLSFPIGAAGVYQCITSGYAHDPLVQYKLLSDDTWTWDTNTASAPIEIRKRFTNLAVRNRNYEGATNVSTGQFFYIFVTGNSIAANLVSPYVRMTYTDI